VRYPDDLTFSNHANATYTITYGTETRTYAFDASGQGGTVTITPLGGGPADTTFALLDEAYSPYKGQQVIDHGSTISPRYLLHTLHADAGTQTSHHGRMASSQWLGYWSNWRTGTYTATR
jgi:hypothetical protein